MLRSLVLVASARLLFFSDFDSRHDFSEYQQFAWISSEPMTVVGDSGPTPLNAARLKRAIEEALISKGFVQVDEAEGADFVVAYTVGGRDRLDVRTQEVMKYYGSHWDWGHEYYGFGIALPSAGGSHHPGVHGRVIVD